MTGTILSASVYVPGWRAGIDLSRGQRAILAVDVARIGQDRTDDVVHVAAMAGPQPLEIEYRGGRLSASVWRLLVKIDFHGRTR